MPMMCWRNGVLVNWKNDDLFSDAEREGDDWRLFGFCHIHEWEWGYLMLSELESIRLPFGLAIEQDIYSAGKTVREFLL